MPLAILLFDPPLLISPKDLTSCARLREGDCVPLAHIAGIPIEETALSLVPVAAATGGLAGARLRRLAARRRERRPAIRRRRS